jgi:hypothetical protein
VGVHWQARKLCQSFATWTADALRVRKVSAHDLFECVHQMFFRVYTRTFE